MRLISNLNSSELKKRLLSWPTVVVMCALCVGFLAGKFTRAPLKQIEQKIEKSEKVAKKKSDHSITVRTETKPDGTTIKTEIKNDVDELTAIDSRLTAKTTLIERERMSFGVSAIVVSSLRNPFSYELGGMVEGKIAGPVWGSVFVTNGLQVGVGIGFKF